MLDQGFTRQALARARSNSRFNAFVSLIDPPRCGATAGPLHDVPVAVKDNIDVAGVPTTCGSLHTDGQPATSDADCVSALLAAGACVIGKTLTHEYAYGSVGDSSAQGAALNPWDPGRVTGGSSAGSAAAVALGIVPLALGSDTGGSSRIPASLCGVFGFKPTSGTLPLNGVFPLSSTLDVVGLLGASADWIYRGWSVLSGRAPRAVSRPLRLAWIAKEDLPPVQAAVWCRTQDLASRNAATEIRLPWFGEAAALYGPILSREASILHAERLAQHPELFQDDVRARLQAASSVTDLDYRRALAARTKLIQAVEDIFTGVDVLLLPTTPVPAPLLGRDTCLLAGEPTPVRDALLSLTKVWSVLGWPALSIPAGTVDGLPVGLQLVGAPGSDATLITLARQLSPQITTYADTYQEESWPTQ